MGNQVQSEPLLSEREAQLTYSLNQFEGPLDLLLHLIEKAQVSIYTIPIAKITDQFLDYLNIASKIDLEDLTEFYLMASHLLLLKSSMLVPRNEEEPEFWEEDRQNLVEQLLEYQKYKKYSSLLSEAEESDALFLPQRKNQFMLPFSDQQLWHEVDVWDLLKTFSSLLSSVTHDKIFNVYEEVTVSQKLALMNELFEQCDTISFMDLIVHERSRLDIICAFLALLEAVKFNMIIIEQHALFGDIQIRRADGFDEGYSDFEEDEFPPEDMSEQASASSFEEQERIMRYKDVQEDSEEDGDDDFVISFDEEDEE